MGKVLIIKNADFSANKVTTITFADVPCTGLSFATDTINITGSESVEVEYTVTPTNTTDNIIWESSDASVVTVSGGVLTVVGIGTCTITATCGNFTATATVTVNIAYIPNWMYGYASQADTFITNNSTSLSRMSAWGSGTQASSYISPDTQTSSVRRLIKLPQNTARVRLSYDLSKRAMLYNNATYFFFAEDVSCGAKGHADAALFVSKVDVDVRSSGAGIATVPSGADLLVISLRLATARTEGDDPATDAETLGLYVEFLPAES